MVALIVTSANWTSSRPRSTSIHTIATATDDGVIASTNYNDNGDVSMTDLTAPEPFTQFEPFPRLSTELRICIWKEVLRQPRIVEVLCQTSRRSIEEYSSRKKRSAHRTAIPLPFRVNSKSRSEFIAEVVCPKVCCSQVLRGRRKGGVCENPNCPEIEGEKVRLTNCEFCRGKYIYLYLGRRAYPLAVGFLGFIANTKQRFKIAKDRPTQFSSDNHYR